MSSNQKPFMNKNETSNADCLQQLVRRLYEARQSAAAAKKVMQEAAEKLGRCEGCHGGDDEASGTRCYQSRELAKEKWCDICKTKLPLWEDYRHKSNMAGASLRMVLQHAQSLPSNEKKAEPPPTRSADRDSGTDNAKSRPAQRETRRTPEENQTLGPAA
jgi:hypothetical protein